MRAAATSLSLSQPWDRVRQQVDALERAGFSYLVVSWPSEGRGRLEEFVEFVGAELRVRDLRPHHVEDWLKSKTDVKASGTKRNYKAIILACLASAP